MEVRLGSETIVLEYYLVHSRPWNWGLGNEGVVLTEMQREH